MNVTKRGSVQKMTIFLLMAGLVVMLGTSCSSADAAEGHWSKVAEIEGLLLEVPADLDEEIKSVIFKETSFGTERLISVSAQDEAGFSSTEWKAIMTAIDMGLVHWDATMPEPLPSTITLDTSDSSFLVSNLERLGKTEITTPHPRLSVTMSDGDFVGELYLYNTDNTTTPLQTLTVNGETTPFFFTDLMSDASYLIVPSHTKGATLLRVVAE